MPEELRRSRRAGIGLRTAALWSSVHDLVQTQAAALDRPLRILDLGGGTGELAVPLAGLGPHVVESVTVVDPSPDALAALARRAGESGIPDCVVALQGDADTLAEVLPGRQFDLVCCHGVLEFVDDPQASLRSLAAAMAPGGALSLLVASRLAGVVHRALAGDFTGATVILDTPDGRWGAGDPLPRRFDLPYLRVLVTAAGLHVQTWHGVRLLSELVPSAHVDTEQAQAALLGLEERLAGHPAYPWLGELGAALHVVARAD